MRRLLFCFIILMSQTFGYSQESNISIYAQFNTVFIYSNYTLNLESFDFLKQNDKHSLKFAVGLGGWSTSAFNENNGTILNYGLTYNYGANSHLLDISFFGQSHFDTGLKEQFLVNIGTTLRPSIGYRFQAISNHYFFRVATGWREILQFSLGWRFK